MVEGSNFVKLEAEEIFSKISHLATVKETIKLWIKGDDSQVYRASEAQNKNGVIMMAVFSEGDEADKQLIDKTAFMSFEVNDVDYFTEADVVMGKTGEKLVLSLNHDVFRSEKRTNERLLTFPHHQVYAYFKIDNEKEDANVISLKQQEDQNYDAYKKAQKEKLIAELAKQIDDVSNLIGFRALDISKTGVAFLVGKEEHEYFEEDKLFDFIILFNGEVINLKNGKLVYNIDFVSPRSNADARFKVGLNFNPDINLSKTVDDIIHESNSLGAIQKEFEQFKDE